MNAGAVLHHYNLTTGHVAKTPRADVSSKTLTLLRPVIERAVGGYAVTLPGFHDHRLSIRNIWHGAVGWLIEGAERRVMVRLRERMDGYGRDEGLDLAVSGRGATGGAPLTPPCAKTRPS